MYLSHVPPLRLEACGGVGVRVVEVNTPSRGGGLRQIPSRGPHKNMPAKHAYLVCPDVYRHEKRCGIGDFLWETALGRRGGNQRCDREGRERRWGGGGAEQQGVGAAHEVKFNG